MNNDSNYYVVYCQGFIVDFENYFSNAINQVKRSDINLSYYIDKSKIGSVKKIIQDLYR